jgi:hypothetical protein
MRHTPPSTLASSPGVGQPIFLSMSTGQHQAQAGWYVDPSDEARLRYFDGMTRTEHVAPAHPAPAEAQTAQDLATHRPGAAARAKALEARRAAPVRSQVARVLGVHTNERAWRIGADGEEEVGRRLGKLGRDWRVLHAVPVGSRGSDIDHVVIGPPGVFTLNTKHHPGKSIWVAEKTLTVSGQRTDNLRNSRFESCRAAALLSTACGFEIPVEAVIVVMVEKLTIKARPSDVHVVPRRGIVKWLKSRPPTLTPEGVAEIYEQARSPVTWK